jgi:hypothetical protein
MPPKQKPQGWQANMRQRQHRFATGTTTTKDKVEAAGAAVAGVAALKGGSYAKGAYKLSRLSPERAASMSHVLNRATGPRSTMHDIHTNPALALKLGGEQRKSVKALKPHLKPHGDAKMAAKGADYWANTFQGMKHSRKAAAGKFGAKDILNFNKRPQAKYLNRIVEHSGPSQTDLYRGIRHPTKLKVGDHVDMPHQTSWTDSTRVAHEYTQARPKTAREALKAGIHDAKNYEGSWGRSQPGHQHVLKLPKGERATNIQGLTRTLQNEHVTPGGKYRVKEIDEHGHHVMERVGKRNVSAFGVVH